MCKLVKQWEDSMRFKKKSENTINSYLLDVEIFLNWIKETKHINEVTIEVIKNVTVDDLEKFMGFLSIERKNSESTVVRRANAVKSFYKFLQKTLKLIRIDENVTLDWELPKIPEREADFLTEEEAQILVHSLGKRNNTRNTAILMLFLTTGLRREELININLTDIQDDSLKVIGKGNKERKVFLYEDTLDAINEWLEVRAKIKPLFDREALFVSEQGKRMSENAVYNFIKGNLKKIGKENCSVHSLRHCAASSMLENGNNLKTVQEVLGHKNMNTTSRYLHVIDKQKKQAASSFKLKRKKD